MRGIVEQEENKVYAAFVLKRFRGKVVNASWMSMFASQPPMQRMSIYLWSAKRRSLLGFGVLKKAGVTFGDILRRVQAKAAEDRCDFRGALIWRDDDDRNMYDQEVEYND